MIVVKKPQAGADGARQHQALLTRYSVDLQVMPASVLDVTAEVQVRWLSALASHVAEAGAFDLARGRVVVAGESVAAIAHAAGVPELFLAALVRSRQVQQIAGGLSLIVRQRPIPPQRGVYETNQSRRANKLRSQTLNESRDDRTN